MRAQPTGESVLYATRPACVADVEDTKARAAPGPLGCLRREAWWPDGRRKSGRRRKCGPSPAGAETQLHAADLHDRLQRFLETAARGGAAGGTADRSARRQTRSPRKRTPTR